MGEELSQGKHHTKSTRIVTAFIAIQIAIPTVMLGARWVAEGPLPEAEYPLSWQMYSAVDNGDYIGITDGGDRTELQTDDLAPIERGIGYGNTVARKLCEEHPDVVSIERVDPNPALETAAVTC